MQYKELFIKLREELDGFMLCFKQDIGSIRTSRATPSLVEDLQVEYFGTRYHIKELASLNVPEPRVLVIQPWDKNALEAISGAIQKSSIGLNPVVDGQVIRLTMPMLTEERRKEFIKLLKHKTEETRIKVRRGRDEVWDKIQKLAKDAEIREDDKFRGKEDLQKIVDEYNKRLEDLEKKK